MRRFAWFEIILIVIVMSISLYGAFSDGQNFSWRWYTRDDAYYYFKVAQNISEGHGSTFDGINKTNGYHPLWMLVCIPIFALARFDLILPLRILFIVSGALSAATAILLYRLIGKVFVPAVGAIAALVWVFSQEVLNAVYIQGLETGIAAFFLVLLSYKLYEFEKSWRTQEVSKKQLSILAVIATLTMFSRLDLVFLAGLVGIWIVFRRSPVRFYLPWDIMAIVISALLAFISRVTFRDYQFVTDLALALVALALIVKMVCAFLFGLYQPHIIKNPLELLKRLLLFVLTSSVITGGLYLMALRFGLLSGSFSRMTLLLDLIFTLVFFGISRFAALTFRTTGSVPVPAEQPLVTLQKNWKYWLNDGVIYYGILIGALGIYMVWNKLAFGTSSPVSGQIKRWWASLPGRPYGGPTLDRFSFFGLNPLRESNAWQPVTNILANSVERFRGYVSEDMRYLLVLCLAALVVYLLLLTQRKKAKTAITELSLVPLFCSTWLQILSYQSTGYAAFKEWYWTTQLIVIFLISSLVIGIVYRWLPKFPYKDVIVWVPALYIGLVMGTAYFRYVYNTMPYHFWAADAPYMDIPPLLEANTESGSLIGMTGGGNTGYFIQDRTIVNMDGLINSYPYFQALQAQAAGAYLESIGLDYVLANPGILDQQPYKGQYNEYMEATGIFYGGKQLMRYGAP